MKFLLLISITTAAFCDSNPIPNCHNTVQGLIPPNNKMPSTLIISPPSNANLTSSTGFQIKLLTTNFQGGLPLTDLNAKHLTQPQLLSSNNEIMGFIKIVIQPISGQSVPDAKTVSFFKQLGVNNEITVNKNEIETKGVHRICTMLSSSSGQPVIMPVAQRGAQDDCIRVNII